MTQLKSTLDPRSAAYADAAEAMTTKLAEVDAEHAKALAGGGAKYVDRHHARGKFTARERLELLLDPDSPFLELSPLAAWGTAFTVGASVVVGIGVVEGVECLIVSNDPTVKGGTSNPWTLRKILRANQIAFQNRLPVISLVESGGADQIRMIRTMYDPGCHVNQNVLRLHARHGQLFCSRGVELGEDLNADRSVFSSNKRTRSSTACSCFLPALRS